ncbi:MAG: hypothetical protein LBU42_05580 [Prevotellaceae bacterium]|jgi:hypothetical protein|nr:hypothetical protein [Prevotellaceae bacterium]
MKKTFILMALVACCFAGCKKDDNGGETTSSNEDGLVFVENNVRYIGDGDKEFEAPKGDYVLDASKVYVIRGWVYIADGSSLRIPAGTLLKGKSEDVNVKGSSLIIERGGKIYIEGTAEKPVVFTSDKPAGQRKPGDWGGIIICGKAKNNQNEMQIEGGPRTRHGGSDDADNSGVITYCRVEFAGYPFLTDKEINGITLGSVGNGTTFHHVQVSYSNDDSFEWFGGAVNATHLVAYHGWDDDFDTDNGFSGTLQFLLGVRHPKIGDTSLSNGFESDNDADGDDKTPYTTAKFCNVTLIGPSNTTEFINEAGAGKYIDAGPYDPNNGSKVGQFQSGVQIRRNSRISLSNAVITGFPVGLMVENDKSVKNTQSAADERQAIKNTVFGGYTDNAADALYDNTATAVPVLGSDKNKTWVDVYSADASATTAGTKSFAHRHALNTAGSNVLATVSQLNLSNQYFPASGSALINAAFTVPSGFNTAGSGYVGAFKSDAAADNWLAGWTNFDPQNTAY